MGIQIGKGRKPFSSSSGRWADSDDEPAWRRNPYIKTQPDGSLFIHGASELDPSYGISAIGGKNTAIVLMHGGGGKGNYGIVPGPDAQGKINQQDVSSALTSKNPKIILAYPCNGDGGGSPEFWENMVNLPTNQRKVDTIIMIPPGAYGASLGYNNKLTRIFGDSRNSSLQMDAERMAGISEYLHVYKKQPDGSWKDTGRFTADEKTTVMDFVPLHFLNASASRVWEKGLRGAYHDAKTTIESDLSHGEKQDRLRNNYIGVLAYGAKKIAAVAGEKINSMRHSDAPQPATQASAQNHSQRLSLNAVIGKLTSVFSASPPVQRHNPQTQHSH